MTIGEREYERHRQTTPNGKLAESYFDLGGVRGPVCEVVDAMAEDNDRLRRELEEREKQLTEEENLVDSLRRELEEAKEKVALGEDALERALSQCHEREQALEEAKAELARMRAVVEAARVCYSGECDMEHAHRQLKYAVRNYDASAGKGGK